MKRYAPVLVCCLLLGMGTVGQGDISINPPEPHFGDVVYITISKYVSWRDRVKYVTIHRQGETVVLDVMWSTYSGPGAGTCWLFEHTQLAGMFLPGTYTVNVNHRGERYFNESTTFTVLPTASPELQLVPSEWFLLPILERHDDVSVTVPEWWSLFRSGAWPW